jgi:hypothetical protein
MDMSTLRIVSVVLHLFVAHAPKTSEFRVIKHEIPYEWFRKATPTEVRIFRGNFL